MGWQHNKNTRRETSSASAGEPLRRSSAAIQSIVDEHPVAFTYEQVAKKLATTVNTVKLMVCAGDLHAFTLMSRGRAVRISAAALQDYLEARDGGRNR